MSNEYNYGVLPARVRYDKSLTPFARLLYCDILANIDTDTICNKNEFYFADSLGVSESTVVRALVSLCDKNYIEFNQDRNIIARVL